MRKTLDGPVGEEILKSCESEGLVGLAFYDSGARSIYGKKPVKTLADAKGMKIRVQQSDLWVALLGAMGANATPMPIGEVYTALKTGLIDAAENNIPSYDGFKHFEAVKFYSRTEHSMAPEMLLMSKAVFDKLPKADQDMIRAAAKESVAFQRKKWDEQEAKSLAVVKAGGAEIVEGVDKASFQAAMGPVYAKFMTTPDLQAPGQGGAGHQVSAAAVPPVVAGEQRPIARHAYTRLCALLSKASLCWPWSCCSSSSCACSARWSAATCSTTRRPGPRRWPAAGAVRDGAGRGGGRARRRPHRAGIAGRAAARALAPAGRSR